MREHSNQAIPVLLRIILNRISLPLDQNILDCSLAQLPLLVIQIPFGFHMEFLLIYKNSIIKIQNVIEIGNITLKQIDMENIMHMQVSG